MSIIFDADKKTTAVVVLLGTVCVLALALLNRAPFFYFDTATYIEQIAKVFDRLLARSDAAQIAAQTTQTGTGAGTRFGVAQADKIVFAGRSVYYGVLAWLGWVSSIWVPVVLQAATLSWLVVTLFRLCVTRWWWQSALLTLAGLGLLSSAGLFAGLVMPDIWAGLMVLALGVLWIYPSRLNARQTALIFAIMTFAVLAHASHLALLAAMLLVLLLSWLIARRFKPGLPLYFVPPILVVCIGILGQLAYGSAVRVAYDAQLLSRPHITAHLVDLGPGTRLIKETCPDSGYALCAYADRLPMPWIRFLFGADPETGVFGVVPPTVQKELVDEQTRFAAQTLKHYPIETLSGLAWDGISQLWTFDIDDVALGARNRSYIEAKFPPDLIQAVKNSRIYDRPDLYGVMLRIIQSTSGAAAAFLLFYGIWQITGNRTLHPELNKVVLLIVAGVVLNALICGILASPYGRFQARIVWLLPLCAALIMSKLFADRSERTRNLSSDRLIK